MLNTNRLQKVIKITPKGCAILFCLLLLFFVDPSLRSFAITYIQPKVNTESVTPDYSYDESIPQAGAPQKSHAPEPSSLILVVSGLCGLVVRFARRSFEKAKRISDIYLAVFGLFIASPLLIIGASLIKLTSPGPILYKQRRVGKKGKIFRIYKLRTMCMDAEKKTGAVWAKENDPRVTQIGKILRKAHIDEIPQLFNVLKGEMSIVGPRPERPEMVRDLKELILDYEKRLVVNPGITGLAQVNHKYDETIEDVKKKIKFDLLYIKRMCWLVEMKIMAQTFVVALTGKGAR